MAPCDHSQLIPRALRCAFEGKAGAVVQRNTKFLVNARACSVFNHARLGSRTYRESAQITKKKTNQPMFEWAEVVLYNRVGDGLQTKAPQAKSHPCPLPLPCPHPICFINSFLGTQPHPFTPGLSSWGRDHVACKPRIFTLSPFQKNLQIPVGEEIREPSNHVKSASIISQEQRANRTHNKTPSHTR